MSADQNPDSRTALYKRLDIRLLLDYTVNGHESILPSITNEGYAYPEINRLLKVADSAPLLEDLASQHLYQRTTVDVEVACPSCASRRTIHDSYACPFCKSASLKRGTILEHYKCGHVGLIEEFAQTDNLVCPKCRGILRLIGTDYSKIQDTFRCGKCNRSFAAPSIIHLCLHCKSKFSYETAKLWPVYSYEFNESLRQEVVSNCVVQLPLVSYLKERGFMVQSPGFIRGQSGIDQDFDIVASRGNKNYVFTIATSATEVTQDTVATLFAKRFDVEAEGSFVIAMPKMNQEGLKMAQLYGIDVIEGEDHTSIMKKIPQSILLTEEHKAREPHAPRAHVPPVGPEDKLSIMDTVQRLSSQVSEQIRGQSEVHTDESTPFREKTEPARSSKEYEETILATSIVDEQGSARTLPRSRLIRPERSEETRCSYCGRSLAQSSQFCDQCGRLIAA